MNVTLAATALALAVVFGYPLLCCASPFGRCCKCHGTGERTTRKGRARVCRRCKGARIRLRIGRRIYNAASGVHAAGTKEPSR